MTKGKRTGPRPTVKEPFNLIAKPIGPVCNIRCEYCYYLEKEELYPEKNSRSAFVMSDKILKSYIRQYIQCQPPGLEEVVFIWQGGEPTLLGIDFFRKVIAFQRQFRRPGMKISNSLQTNGTLLTDDFAAFLADEDFLVGLSIDGPEELHNRYRKDREGKGTFSRVMRGLDFLKKHEVRFNTLTVIQEDNGKHPVDVYRFLKEIGSAYYQFIPIVEPVPGAEKVTGRSVTAERWGSFLTGVFDEWILEDIGQIFVSHFDMMLALHAGYPSTFCVHSRTCGKALAMEHNGDLYSCDHFVFPEYKLGNIGTTGMVNSYESLPQKQFGQSKFDSLPEECRECKYLVFCYGGCPKNRLLHGTGGKLNWLCEGYKQFYRHSYLPFSAMKRALDNQVSPSRFREFLSLEDLSALS